MAIRTADTVSNFASVPIAAVGRTCTDVYPGLYLGSQVGPPPETSGWIELYAEDLARGSTNPGSISPISGSRRISELFHAEFTHVPASSLAHARLPKAQLSAAFSNCQAWGYKDQPPNLLTEPRGVSPYTTDAGVAIKVTTAAGSRLMTRQADGSYEVQSTDASVLAAGGKLTVDNGAGGTRVGPFQIEFQLGDPMVWTNIDSVNTVDRTMSLTLTWKDGKPKTFVVVEGESIDAAAKLHTRFACWAPVDAGQITIPPSASLAMIASSPFDTSVSPMVAQYSTISLSTSESTPFGAPGLDVGYLYVGRSLRKVVTFK